MLNSFVGITALRAKSVIYTWLQEEKCILSFLQFLASLCSTVCVFFFFIRCKEELLQIVRRLNQLFGNYLFL